MPNLKVESQNQRWIPIVILFAYVITISLFWYYPTTGFVASEDFELGPGQVLFRYATWALLISYFYIICTKHGIYNVTSNLLLFTPLMLCGTLISLINENLEPIYIQYLAFGFIMLLTAPIFTYELKPEDVCLALCWIFGIEIVLSIVLVVVAPASAILGTGLRESWRGGFAGKGFLGIASAWLVVQAVCTRHRLGTPTMLVLIGLGVLCLIKSDSIGPMFACVISVGHLFILSVVRRMRVPPVLGSFLIVLLYGLIGLTLSYSFAPILAFFNRDETLTGRTEIWPVYFELAMKFWPIGAGAAMLTTPSELTLPLEDSFISYGHIIEPHNTFIAMLGEGGLLGLVFYFGPLFYLAFWQPLVSSNKYVTSLGALTMLELTVGLTEANHPFTMNAQTLVIYIYYILASRARRGDRRVQLRAR